jgi:hypothetical protein
MKKNAGMIALPQKKTWLMRTFELGRLLLLMMMMMTTTMTTTTLIVVVIAFIVVR